MEKSDLEKTEAYSETPESSTQTPPDLSICECQAPGMCPRYRRPMTGHLYDICAGKSKLSAEKEQGYRESFWAQRHGVRQPPPGLIEQLNAYKKAFLKWAAAGKPLRSDEEIERIYTEICQPCELFSNDHCTECACKIKSGGKFFNKLAWATEECPHPDGPKWEATA